MEVAVILANAEAQNHLPEAAAIILIVCDPRETHAGRLAADEGDAAFRGVT